jgi:hypothetical protein
LAAAADSEKPKLSKNEQGCLKDNPITTGPEAAYLVFAHRNIAIFQRSLGVALQG